MFHILVVEDDRFQIDCIVKMLHSIGVAIHVYTADSKEKGLLIAKRHKIDLFFIDVELKGSSGIDLAKELRKLPDYRLKWIIFITTHVQYMLQAFKETHCFDYILKPFSKDQLIEITKLIMEGEHKKSQQSVSERRYVVFDCKGIFLKVFVDEIIFIEVNLRTSTIYTRKKEYVIPKLPLKKALEVINDPHIIQSHKAYAVNVRYISEIRKLSPTCYNAYFDQYNKNALIGSKFLRSVELLFTATTH